MESRMFGATETYLTLFKRIMSWDSFDKQSPYYSHGTHKILGNEEGHELWELGYSLSEMDYHGWRDDPADDELADNERQIFDKVETAYLYLLKSLAEAIGFEYTDENVWKYHLQYIDTNDILKLAEERKAREKSETPIDPKTVSDTDKK